MKKSTWMKARLIATSGAIGLGQGATAFWTACQIIGRKKLISKIAYGALGVAAIAGQQYAYCKFVDQGTGEICEQELLEIDPDRYDDWDE